MKLMENDSLNRGRRHSIAGEPEIVTDPVLRAEIEAENGLKQFDLLKRSIEDALSKGSSYKIRPSLLQALHREALQGLSSYAGNWRPASVGIQGSRLNPVEAHLVAEKIEELCDYLNDQWNLKTAVHLSAYAMWRLNWVHPFSDGNGRTSRAISYFVLCLKIGALLPGEKTIPDYITENRNPYFSALESADRAFLTGAINVSEMEELLGSLLAKQLLGVVEAATDTK